jgi:hypothetical protein
MTDERPISSLLPPLPPYSAPDRTRPRPLVIATLIAVSLCMSSCVGCLVIGSRASGQGLPYAAAAIRSITKPWDPEALISRSSPALRKTMPPEKMRTVIAFAGRRLGDLKECTPVQKAQWTSYVGTEGFLVFATYVDDCEFEKASGSVTMQLVRRGGTWQVNGFFLNSDALMGDPVTPSESVGATKE